MPTTRPEHHHHVISGLFSGSALNVRSIVLDVIKSRRLHKGTKESYAVIGDEVLEEVARDVYFLNKNCTESPDTVLLGEGSGSDSGSF